MAVVHVTDRYDIFSQRVVPPVCASQLVGAQVVHRIEFQLPSLRKETGPGLPGLDVTKSDLIQEFQSEVSGKMLQDVARRCKFRSVDGASVTKCHQVWKSGRP